LILALLCLSAVTAQDLDVKLATAGELTFTADQLSSNVRSIFLKEKEIVAERRAKLFEEMISEALLEQEARSQKTTREQMLAAEFAKIPKVTEAAIRSVYDANRSAIGDRTIDQMRSQIIDFLRHEAEIQAERELITKLKTKYKYSPGKGVNAQDLRQSDAVAMINGRSITVGEFETANRIALNDLQHHIFHEVRTDLEDVLLSKLIEIEARSRSIDASTLIANEITDKMREFSDSERASLLATLQDRLFAKYNVKFLLPEPEQLVLDVSVDDDPTIGPKEALVTVVMFVDFQCSACARFSPIVKNIAAEFQGKVRLAVRDFPLTEIHENAFAAALAANAAHRQGKYFEYSEALYKNQDSLGPAQFRKLAEELSLDLARFEREMGDESTASEVRKDMADGKRYGVSGTPTIFVNGVKLHHLSEIGLRRSIEKQLNTVR
jgi:protein-disulfide isomerase-like protein with CxxC motif